MRRIEGFLICMALALVLAVNFAFELQADLPNNALTPACEAPAHVEAKESLEIDPSGYVLYCPCMGRLGNQMSHLLGAINFAMANNRTLVVPPFIEYHGTPRFIPYASHFNLSALAQVHRVIAMETFMKEIAPRVWPAAERHMYCFVNNNEMSQPDCQTKQGSPFGPFWDHFSVDFVRDVGITPSFDAHPELTPLSHPVIALRGAPAAFPVEVFHRYLQRYVVWNQERVEIANSYIDTHLARPFVAAHARVGSDWVSVCRLGDGWTDFMENAQCNRTRISAATCLPPLDDMATTIVAAARTAAAQHVLIGCDDPDVAPNLVAAVHKIAPSLVVHVAPPSEPFLTAHLFSVADLFVGNCVSSFTAIAARTRAVTGLPTWFFGIPVS
eukprot:m.20423 g.20423  ORF g.20423 m.20423 type:complete len:385 (-) comp7833_c0_seq1:36-1190(-)